MNDGPSEGDNAENAADRRRHFRVGVPLKARFLTPGGEEHPCLVSNISAGGALLRTKMPPQSGQAVVLYVDELGRFEGKVIRSGQNSFAVSYAKRRARSQKTADKLTRVVNQSRCSIDRRNAPRIEHDAPAVVQFEDGQSANCAIVDISLTGASIDINPRPPLGANLTLGKMSAKVVRRHEKGVGLVFTGPARRMGDVISNTAAEENDALGAETGVDGAAFAKSFGRKGARA